MDIPIPPELALAGDPPFDEQALDLALDPEVRTNDFLDPRDGERVETARRWQIEDDGAAEWAMRHLAAIDRERCSIAEQADLWFERIREWQDGELHRLEPRRDFFAGRLREYGLRVRAEDPRRATISLPSGKVSTKAPKEPMVRVVDEEKVIEWAEAGLTDEEYEQVIRTTRKVLVSEVRKGVKFDARREIEERDAQGEIVGEWVKYEIVWAASGEVVPGLVAEMPETSATVTPAQ